MDTISRLLIFGFILLSFCGCQKELIGCQDAISDIDGNQYNLVEIGNQCWCQSNLKTSRYRNGDPIPFLVSDSEWQSTVNGAYSIYGNNPINDSIYGKLYNWYAVDDKRGLCPQGFKVPSERDWNELEQFLGMPVEAENAEGIRGTIEGSYLKSSSGWGANGNGINTTGFTGLPSGARSELGVYVDLTLIGPMWGTTEANENESWRRGLNALTSGVYRLKNLHNVGLGVRCLKK